MEAKTAFKIPKTNRPAKVQYKCFICKTPCQPKHGDWMPAGEDVGHDVFVCHGCGRRGLRPEDAVKTA